MFSSSSFLWPHVVWEVFLLDDDNFVSAAFQPIKEWKPKSTKKSADADNSVADAVSPSATNTENANAPDVNGLSDKLSQADLHEVEHVIIPEHLRVPEYEQTKLRFGSFTSGFDSEQVPASTSPDSELPEQLG
jgi:hypothetical protein